MVREAALYRYISLAIQVEGEAGELQAAEPAWLQAALAAAVRHPYEWLGRPLPADQPAVVLPSNTERRRVRRLYPPAEEGLAWADNGRWAAYAQVHLANGMVALRLAYGCRGEADAATWERLAQAAAGLPALADERFFRGETLCLAGRVPDPAAAEAAAACGLPADPAQPAALRRADLPLADGRVAWLFDRPGLPDRLACFYPDDDAAEAAIAPFFNAALPDLLLSLHKIAHQYGRGYEQALRPLLAARERPLAAVLAQEAPPAGDVAALDARLQALAGAYNAFARELAIFDRLAQAVRVNLLNLRQGFAEHGLPQAGPLAAWLTAAERAAGQMEADDGFYRARVRQAEMALAALQVQADIERAHLEQEENRRDAQRNLLLGLIAAVLALGQVMSDAVVGEFLGRLIRGLGRTPLDPMPAGLVFLTKLLLVTGIAAAVAGLFRAASRLRRRQGPR